MSQFFKRRRLFIDYPIQGTLLLRAAGYWAVSLLTQVLMVVYFAVVAGSPNDFYVRGQQLWWHLELALLGSVLVLPMILIDILRLSHRWVGPVFRLRAAVKALSHGENVSPIRFREGDFWQELAGDFNLVAAELARRRAEQANQAVTERLPVETESATVG